MNIVLDDTTYLERYAVSGQEIIKFGLNPTAVPIVRDPTFALMVGAIHDVRDVLASSEEFADHEVVKKLYAIAAAHEGTMEGISDSASVRSGISNKSGKKLLKEVEAIRHHPLEMKIFKNAVEHLLDDDDCKTVLVDIFARDGNMLKVDKSEEQFEVHTVVLYKNPADSSGKHSILVIDPSSNKFSVHLANHEIRMMLAEAGGVIEEKMLFKGGVAQVVVNTDKEFCIYRPYDSNHVGPALDEARDCVDVAVKIALALDLGAHQRVNSSDLKRYPIIQMLSNNPKIDTTLPEGFLDEVPLRLKQASNVEVSRAFARYNAAMTKLTAAMDNLSDSDDNGIEVLHTKVIQDVGGKMPSLSICVAQFDESLGASRELLTDAVVAHTEAAQKGLADLLGDTTHTVEGEG